MAHLIDKDAVVAEIEKLISNGKLKCQQSQENNDQVSYIAWSEHIATCGKILLFINTLEVKEVDFKDIKSVFEGQYLNKDKVVTTIEKLQDECEEKGDNNGIELLEKLFNKLDTLKVEKVDLNKEIDEHWDDWAKKMDFILFILLNISMNLV